MYPDRRKIPAEILAEMRRDGRHLEIYTDDEQHEMSPESTHSTYPRGFLGASRIGTLNPRERKTGVADETDGDRWLIVLVADTLERDIRELARYWDAWVTYPHPFRRGREPIRRTKR